MIDHPEKRIIGPTCCMSTTPILPETPERPAFPQPVRSRQRSAAAFLISGQFATALTVVIGFVSTPLLLHWLGPERYGLIRVLDSWTAYLGIATYCMTLATGMALVPRLASQDKAAVASLVFASVQLLSLLAVFDVVVGLALVPILSLLAPVPPELTDERLWAYLISLGAFVMSPLAICRALFESDQRGYRVHLALSVNLLVQTGLALLAAWLGWGVPGQAAATMAALTVQLLFLLVWVLRDYPWFALWHADQADRRLLFRSMHQLLLIGALGIVGSRVEGLVANFVAGTAEVTVYLLTQKLFSLATGQLVNISNAVWVSFSDLYHRGLHDAFRTHVRTCNLLLCGLGYAVAVPLVVYDQAFLDRWVGGARYGGDALAITFGLLLPLAAAQSLQGWLLTATGHTRHSLPGVAVSCLVTIVGCSSLGMLWGLVGVALGAALGTGAMVLGNLFAMRRALAIPLVSFSGPYLRATALALVFGPALWWVARIYPPCGWITLLVCMLVAGATYLTLWAWTSLSALERRQWLVRIGDLLHLRRGARAALNENESI